MSRVYTEIRIHHDSEADKIEFERRLNEKVKANNFSSRAEYVRFVAVNAEISVRVKEGEVNEKSKQIKG